MDHPCMHGSLHAETTPGRCSSNERSGFPAPKRSESCMRVNATESEVERGSYNRLVRFSTASQKKASCELWLLNSGLTGSSLPRVSRRPFIFFFFRLLARSPAPPKGKRQEKNQTLTIVA
ncbi:unnamed protein product, partial [Ectocarpus sp. 4 AP-2014]